MSVPWRLRAGGAWSVAETEAFLAGAVIPVRLAAIGMHGIPLVVSLWYLYEDGCLWCATQRDARVARLLAADPRCGFEVAPEAPPYHGVRGQGRAGLRREGAQALLGRLIDRYLGDRDTPIARWLLDRAVNEIAIRIEPSWIAVWDYRARMRAGKDGR